MIRVRLDRTKPPINTDASSEQLVDAARMGLNDTVKEMRTFAWRHINKVVAIKKPEQSQKTPKQVVESRISLSWAKRGETQGVIEIKAATIPLVWFDPKDKKIPSNASRGEGDRKNKKRARVKRYEASVKKEKGAAREVVPGGFGPRTEKLGRTVWKRAGKARKPLVKPKGVEVPEILRRRGGVQELTAKAEERLAVNIARRIKRIKYWWGKRRGQQPKADA
jgi:hypothetical protein